jgi:hypothetical protein
VSLLAGVTAASPSAFDQPGTLGFLVVFGMGIILFFLFRSMTRHLRKVNGAAAAAAAEQASQDPVSAPGDGLDS